MKTVLVIAAILLSGCSALGLAPAKPDPAVAAACKLIKDQATCDAQATCAWGARPSDQLMMCRAK